MWCVADNSLHVISDARAFALFTVVPCHCGRWRKSKIKDSARMRTAASLKVAPVDDGQTTDCWIAPHYRADWEIVTKLVKISPFRVVPATVDALYII